jgi:hypothetical protein
MNEKGVAGGRWQVAGGRWQVVGVVQSAKDPLPLKLGTIPIMPFPNFAKKFLRDEAAGTRQSEDT